MNKKTVLPLEGAPFYVDYLNESVETEQSAQATVNTREAHEGQTQQTGSNQYDSGASHTLRDIQQGHLLTDACKHH